MHVQSCCFAYETFWFFLTFSLPFASLDLKALMTFKMASKVFIEEADKNFDFITEILFRFLGFGGFKVSIVIEN